MLENAFINVKNSSFEVVGIYETGVATLIANQLMRVGTQNPVVLILVIMLTAGLLIGVAALTLFLVELSREVWPVEDARERLRRRSSSTACSASSCHSR